MESEQSEELTGTNRSCGLAILLRQLSKLGIWGFGSPLASCSPNPRLALGARVTSSGEFAAKASQSDAVRTHVRAWIGSRTRHTHNFRW